MEAIKLEISNDASLELVKAMLKTTKNIYQALFLEGDYDEYFSNKNDPIHDLAVAVLAFYDLDEPSYQLCCDAIYGYQRNEITLDDLMQLLDDEC